MRKINFNVIELWLAGKFLINLTITPNFHSKNKFSESVLKWINSAVDFLSYDY
jgi:hypothetical protein